MPSPPETDPPALISRRRFIRKTSEGMAGLALGSLIGAEEAEAARSGSPAGEKLAGSIRRRGSRWILQSDLVERIVEFRDGKLQTISLKNRVTGYELAPKGGAAEFFVSIGAPSERRSSAEGTWALLGAKRTRLKQGEIQLDVALQQGQLQVAKHYVVYPGSSIIREWVTFTNGGQQPLQVIEPGFLSLCVRPGDPAKLDFHWMTGGEDHPEMWLLKTEKLSPAQPRLFDSYDPFPTGGGNFPGDGINAKILLNDRQIWPAQGWQYVPNATVTVPFEVIADIAAGDRLVFLVNMNHNIGWDTTTFDPSIRYEDGETHTASTEFSNEQGRSGWRYQYLENGKFIDLVFYDDRKEWRKVQDNPTGTPFVSAGKQHPDSGQDAARVWTAPKAGRVRITGSVCNTGNRGGGGGGGFRMGSSSYAPWTALLAGDTGSGLFTGWDYFGHWASSYTLDEKGAVTIRMRVAGHHQVLKPGESVTTPKAFVGLFRDDLDEAGNELLDWQYRYLWDYTRKGWFPAVRMLGFWWNGTGWGQPGVEWTGGKTDFDSTFRKVFRVADLMREVGGDVYHRDWGWWDRAGDWNGPDFRGTHDYLRKHGMGQLIYAFLYTVDGASRVAREHPDWVLAGGTLDMSRPEVVQFMGGQLDTFYEKWGDFEWRNDSVPSAQKNGDDTVLLGQDQGFREVIQSFLDRHPDCAFQSVNDGGNEAGYDNARYSSSLQFSDGSVGIRHNYYASLLFPPDKNNDNPDQWNPDRYDRAIWRRLLCSNFDMTGDTWDPVKLEGVREMIDIYHYLAAKGVVGRWVRVYRPIVIGDDPVLYFQRLSGDRRRGVLIPKRPAPGPVTLKPKGLLPGEKYIVSYQETAALEERTGADLMDRGITLDRMAPGELIYLNLPLHPGSKRDTVPPGAPRRMKKTRGENMGYPGIELSWTAASDNNWISYYQVFRDGHPLGRAAKGLYLFDHSAGADLSALYEVCAVDGAGNLSLRTAAVGPAAPRARVIDDAPGGGITYTGSWHHQDGQLPAHAGTLSLSNEKGATAEVSFQGRRVLVFVKLGANAGQASVQVDDAPAEVIDAYSADDIWGVCIYRKDFPVAGPHTLRLTVLGQHGPHASDSVVALDGVRVEE